MQVIGVDPHKGSYTAAAVTVTVKSLTRCTSRAGHRARVLSGSSGHKTNSHDARAVAIAALHAVHLTVVAAEHHSQVLRLLSERRAQLSATRTQTVARLHNLLAELLPGGAKRQLSADAAGKLLRQVRPATAVDECRRELARALLEDLRRLDHKFAVNKTRIEAAAAMSNTTLPKVQGGNRQLNSAQSLPGPAAHPRRQPLTRRGFARFLGVARDGGALRCLKLTGK